MKNLIVTSDWHLRDDRPRCRPKGEDWFELQEKSIAFTYETSAKYNADICICGDISHYDTISNRLLNVFLKYVLESDNVNTYILPGQHDILYHSLDDLSKTTYGILNEIAYTNKTPLKLMSKVGMSAPFGVEEFEGVENGLYFTHVLCVPNRKSIYGSMSGISAKDLLEKYPKAEVIFVGDNHHGFFYPDGDGRCVVAPGCLIRQSYALKGYCPGFFLYTENNKKMYEIQEIQNKCDVADLVQDNHIEKREMSNESISAFVESLKGMSKKSFTLSFIDNLKKAMEDDTLESDCVEFIQKIIMEVKR